MVGLSSFASLLVCISGCSSAYWFGSCSWNLRTFWSSWFSIWLEWILHFFELLVGSLSFLIYVWWCILVHLIIQLLCSLLFFLSLLNKFFLFLQTFYCCVLAIILLFKKTILYEKTNICIEGVDLFHFLIIGSHVMLHLF